MKTSFKKSISFKIFIITSILLITLTLFTYLFLYFMLPSYYYNYKKSNINSGLDKLVSQIEGLPQKESDKYIDSFSEEYNVGIKVLDPKGADVYMPDNFILYKNGEIKKSVIGKLPALPSLPFKKTNTVFIMSIRGGDKVSSIYTTSRKIILKDSPNLFTIYVSAALQPISEASKVLILFMPYIGLIVLIVSIIGSLIYSRIISKPLIRINRVAHQMAGLDFTKKCSIYSEDEIGELSSSLNELSLNLQRSMDELKNANTKLIDDIEKEREIEKKRREFISVISHELKTPITIIMGQLEGMIENVGAYKDHDKYLNRSLRVLQDMESMVREVLEISRLESHSFEPNLGEVNLSALVNDCIDKLKYLALEKDIKIIPEVEENLLILADYRLIVKALSNVINNSITHSSKNARISITLARDGGNILLKVENTGVHIENEELEEIFKPFYRIEKSRNRSTGGSGLGLYIVKMVLEAHEVPYAIYNTVQGVEFKMAFREF